LTAVKHGARAPRTTPGRSGEPAPLLLRRTKLRQVNIARFGRRTLDMVIVVRHVVCRAALAADAGASTRSRF
jgi:hypothetical protein